MSPSAVSHHDEKHTGHSDSLEAGEDHLDGLGIGMQDGVKKVEALQRVWSPGLKVALYISIALARLDSSARVQTP